MNKFSLIFFNFLMVCAYPTTDILLDYVDHNDKNWYLIPQIDGNFKWMNTSEIKSELENFPETRGPPLIIYRLHTRENSKKGENIIMNDPMTLWKSNFNPKHPTRIIIHGWQSDINAPINKLICNAYLTRGHFNVISIDWSSVASSINYIKVQSNVNDIGKRIAEFIDFLHDFGGMNLNNLYLIGHSLGAHASGFAGKYVTRGQVNTIIGLDPADPLFPHSDESRRLSVKDAEYVETIHTNAGLLGIMYPIGNASFYPNGGKWQPGCSVFNLTCSHGRSYEFYAESINNDNRFIPVKCENFDDLLYSNCSKEMVTIRMGGEPSNYGKADGIFYLQTNSESPYGTGPVRKFNT